MPKQESGCRKQGAGSGKAENSPLHHHRKYAIINKRTPLCFRTWQQQCNKEKYRLDHMNFIKALKSNSISDMQNVPKSDLHSHAGRGGTIAYVENMLKIKLTPLVEPLSSIAEMNRWFQDNIKRHFPDNNGYIQRVAAAFVQAKADNISVLAMSYGVGEVYYLGGIDIFIAVMDGLHKAFAPETIFLPDLFLWETDDLFKLDELFSANWFRGVDICNYAGTMSMADMKSISRKARAHSLITKAHVGESGGADDVMRYAEELELDQIQHGIAAAESPQIMQWLAKNKIQLNVCPTSNILLKNTKSYGTHQIRKLFNYGVPVTINSDDLLIFNASVSQEFLNLYNAGLMTAEELNAIRETGLSSI